MKVRKTAKAVLARAPLVEALFRRFIWSRIHFPEAELRVLHSLPKGAIDTAIDVGAAQGSYTWVLNRKARKVFAFEPGEQHGRFLRRALFGTRISLIGAAAGDANTKATMYVAGCDGEALHSATMSSMNPIANASRAETRQVRQITLDAFEANEIDVGRSIDLLKIDVEGYELQVLRGAKALIERHLPLIICEIEKRHNPDYQKAFEFLWSLGYESYLLRTQRFELFRGVDIDDLQREENLAERLGGGVDSRHNAYINNFVFQHSKSRLKIAA